MSFQALIAPPSFTGLVVVLALEHLPGTALEGLAKEENLELIVDRQHTSTSDATQDIGTSALEERHDALLLDDLGPGVDRALVLDSLTRSHHHATTDGVKRIGGDTSTSGDAPAEKEGRQEVVGQGSGEDQWLD